MAGSTYLYLDLNKYLSTGNTGASTSYKRGQELFQDIKKSFSGNSMTQRFAKTAWVIGNETANARRAFGVYTLSSGSGTITATINGVALSGITWATSDTVSAGLLVTQINASTDAKHQYIITASNYQATVAFSSVAAGDSVNILGVPFTMQSTSALGATQPTYFYGSSDANAATNLASKINAHPALGVFVGAYASSSTVYMYLLDGAVMAPFSNVNSTPSSTVTVSSSFATSANTAVSCVFPGVIGNQITLAISGTGSGTANITSTRPTNGTGGVGSAPVVENPER